MIMWSPPSGEKYQDSRSDKQKRSHLKRQVLHFERSKQQKQSVNLSRPKDRSAEGGGGSRPTENRRALRLTLPFRLKPEQRGATEMLLTGWGNEMFTVRGLMSEASGDAEEHSFAPSLSPTAEPPPI